MRYLGIDLGGTTISAAVVTEEGQILSRSQLDTPRGAEPVCDAVAAAARQARSTGLTCLRCGGEMLKCGRYPIQLGDEGLLGPVFRDGLMASWMKVDILRCCGCGRAEFFLPEDMDRDAQFRETPGEMVTCPVCGTQHSSLVGCPTCAVKAASGGRVRGGTEQGGGKTSGSKPPWEF